mmetsp:Transcript_26174/g.81957  ORF Transcript_26174/g.81957 Transcript_26174/m.81957 type:complete len:212 (+) Transcript_26174:296-931(+)
MRRLLPHRSPRPPARLPHHSPPYCAGMQSGRAAWPSAEPRARGQPRENGQRAQSLRRRRGCWRHSRLWRGRLLRRGRRRRPARRCQVRPQRGRWVWRRRGALGARRRRQLAATWRVRAKRRLRPRAAQRGAGAASRAPPRAPLATLSSPTCLSCPPVSPPPACRTPSQPRAGALTLRAIPVPRLGWRACGGAVAISPPPSVSAVPLPQPPR